MAYCDVCGDTVGMFSSLCKRCKETKAYHQQQQEAKARAEAEAAEARALAEEKAAKQRAEEERQQENARWLKTVRDKVKQRLSEGEHVWMYRTIYIPVDSVVNGEPLAPNFDIKVIQQFALVGWDVVQVIPRTIGLGLKNVSVSVGAAVGGGTTWGAGIGGIVAGVHVLLRKSIQESDLDEAAANHFVDSYLMALRESPPSN